MPLDHPAPPATEQQAELGRLRLENEDLRKRLENVNEPAEQMYAMSYRMSWEAERRQVAELRSALRRERDSSHRARLVLAPHPGATPADDTGCGCAVASLEELAVAVVERLRREREESERFGSFLAHAAERGEQLDVALRSAVADRDKYKASLDQFLRDTSEAMSCLPGCDSQAHEELCPVVNPAAAWRMLNADRDRYRAALEEIAASYPDRQPGAEHGCCLTAAAALAPPTPAAQESKGE